MAFTYLDLQNEVKRRATRDQTGTEYDTAVKNIINTSLFRVAREAHWKPLRKTDTFTTEAEYSTGTISATEDSNSFTGTSLNFITNGIEIGRRIDIEGSNLNYIIATITGEDAFTTDLSYDGDTDTGLTHTVFGREEYVLPMQTGQIGFLWHEKFGYPHVLTYVPSREFFLTGTDIPHGDIPTHYRMWGEDDVLQQPIEGSAISISSSAAADQSINVTVFGIVSGYPDYETITTNSSNGTTAVAGSKSFTKVERVTKAASTTGRITLTANTANVTVAVLPVGDTAGRVQYKKISLHPLPETAFPVHVWYYKDPWRLVNDGDMHELGHDFDESLILLSVSKIKYEDSQKEGDRWFQMYRDEIISLKRVNADKLDWIPTLKRPQRRGGGDIHRFLSYAQLGGYYGGSS